MRFTLKSNINYQKEIIYVGVKIEKEESLGLLKI